MTSFCLSTPTLSSTSKTLLIPSATSSSSSSSSSSTDNTSRLSCRCSLVLMPLFRPGRNETMRIHYSNRRAQKQVVCMAPDEEKLTRRNPLDFPIEWERPKPGRRPDIFPQFSPMKTPLPPPLPCDPPEEDEEEEEKKEEEEEDPEKEETDTPEKQ